VIGTNFLHDLALEARIKKTDFPKMSAKQFRQLNTAPADFARPKPSAMPGKTVMTASCFSALAN
jgi:hypothetical protein